MRFLWGRITRRFWAWVPDSWLRVHILQSELWWSGKCMSDDELAEHVSEWRRFR